MEAELRDPEQHSLKRPSKVEETFQALGEQLSRVLHTATQGLSPSQRFDDLIPVDERRRVWMQLHEAGVALPALQLSGRVFMLFASLVFLSAVVLCHVCHWSFAFCVVELGAITRKAARPWATYPPYGCETLHEAALQLTRFDLADYRKGLWSFDEIKGKIRLILCDACNLPFDSIRGSTRIQDLVTD
ncbi:MAG: hypothetical protein HY040_22175 [Planctomycetes bacterium]|nr:hypothetical protein [Planctomycetota bacterium]